MVTGRNQFQKVKAILRIGVTLLQLFPDVLLRFFWSLSSPFDGKLAIASRYCLACARGAHLGDNVLFGPQVAVVGFDGLNAGDNVSFQAGCYIDARGGISLGSNVSIAHHSSLVSFEHCYEAQDTPIKYQPLRFEQIDISSDVWIGAGARILAGSQIGTRTVIGAGAVVKGGLQTPGVYVGTPARLIRQLEGQQA